MTLAIDGSAATNSTWSGTNSGTVTVSTTGSLGVLLVAVFSEATSTPSATVSSVSASGLSFSQRVGIQNNGAGEVGNSWNDLELWWAPYSSQLSSKVVTVTLSETIDDACIVAFGISGCNTSSPWDPTSPSTNNASTSSTFTTTQSTSNANDMLLYICGQQTATALTIGSFGSSAATAIFTAANSNGTNSAGIAVQYLVVSSTQSAISDKMTSSQSDIWLGIADAIVAASGGGGPTLAAQSVIFI